MAPSHTTPQQAAITIAQIHQLTRSLDAKVIDAYRHLLLDRLADWIVERERGNELARAAADSEIWLLQRRLAALSALEVLYNVIGKK